MSDTEYCTDWKDDNKAWEYLKSKGFIHNHFIIYPPADHEITEKECSAIDYLVSEWDWGCTDEL